MLIWATFWPDLLPKKAREMLDNEENERFFSPVGIWEVTIKSGQARPDFTFDPRVLRRKLLGGGIVELPITSAHALAVGELPSIHKDPFDRILLAQAKEEGLTLLTTDTVLSKYPISVQYFPKRQLQ